MMPFGNKKTPTSPEAKPTQAPEAQKEHTPQLMIVDWEQMSVAISLMRELLSEQLANKPTLRATIDAGIQHSVVGPFSTPAKDEGQ